MRHVLADLSLATLKPLVRKAIVRVVAPELGKPTAETVLEATWDGYREQHDQLPPEPTVGAAIMVHLAALTSNLFQSLRREGMAADRAQSLTAAVTWVVYERVCGLPWALTAPGARSSLQRVERAMKLFMRFPYAEPGYSMAFVDAGDGSVGFDVARCPVADYFASRGQLSLCKEAFCDLDYPLAERWGVTLTRERQISTCDRRCEFRFRSRSPKRADLE